VRDRSRAREWALRVLYAWETRRAEEGLEAVLEEFLARRVVAPARKPYLRRLIAALDADMPAIDAELQRSLTNWRLERLSVIDRNVLRLGATEMIHFADVPPRVSIQEALNLADRYGTDRSPGFVNGVLDALMRRLPRS
jgi:transcription antitermination protein NusB